MGAAEEAVKGTQCAQKGKGSGARADWLGPVSSSSLRASRKARSSVRIPCERARPHNRTNARSA